MIKQLLLLYSLTLSTLSFTMQEEQRARPRTREEQIAKWAPKAALFVEYPLLAPAALPEELAPFCPYPIPAHTERLTDAMFLSLPAVQELQALDSKAKDSQLQIIYSTAGGSFIYYAKRLGIAACVTAGANPNGFEYNTLIRIATIKQDFALVQFLLEHGANPNQKNFDRTPTINFAGNKYLAKLLHAYGAELHTDLLHQATARQCSPKLLAWYIKQGLDVNAKRGNFYQTPFHSLTTWIGTRFYSIEDISAKCRMLLDASAKTNIKNENGDTFINSVNRIAQENIKSAETQQKCNTLIALVLTHPTHPNNCSLQKR